VRTSRRRLRAAQATAVNQQLPPPPNAMRRARRMIVKTRRCCARLINAAARLMRRARDGVHTCALIDMLRACYALPLKQCPITASVAARPRASSPLPRAVSAFRQYAHVDVSQTPSDDRAPRRPANRTHGARPMIPARACRSRFDEATEALPPHDPPADAAPSRASGGAPACARAILMLQQSARTRQRVRQEDDARAVLRRRNGADIQQDAAARAFASAVARRREEKRSA